MSVFSCQKKMVREKVMRDHKVNDLPSNVSHTHTPTHPHTLTASLLVRLKEVQVDVYLDQPAGSGKHNWNQANDHILRNVK